MAMREQPCPYRIVDDFGNGFSMGCVAGVILYFVRGVWYAPKREKIMGGISLLKKRAPILGGTSLLSQVVSPFGPDSSPLLIAPSSASAKRRDLSTRSLLVQSQEVC